MLKTYPFGKLLRFIYKMSIEKAIDIMEPQATLTDEQLAQIEADADLREACLDVMIMQGVLAEQKKHTATTRRLHQQHPHRFATMGRRLGWGILVAALFAGAVFLLWPARQSADAERASLNSLAGDITVTNAKGQSVALNVAKADDAADAIYKVEAQSQTAGSATAEASASQPMESVTIPIGHSLLVCLSDGSRVFLHPGSRLVYPVVFPSDSREVTLTGEAYFCVTHDQKRPFTVHTSQGVVRDYGTEFNVSTNENLTEVVLIAGSVGVSCDHHAEQLLQPGQMATLDAQYAMPTIRSVDTDPYTAWRDGYFYFNEQTLGDIITQLACSYNLTVECHNTDLLHLRLRYIIPRSSTAAYAIEILDRLQKGHISLEGNRIVIR